MNYDSESTYWKCQSIYEDLEPMLDLLFTTTFLEKDFSFVEVFLQILAIRLVFYKITIKIR